MYSIVKKDCKEDELLVKARLKEDLERLAENEHPSESNSHNSTSRFPGIATQAADAENN